MITYQQEGKHTTLKSLSHRWRCVELFVYTVVQVNIVLSLFVLSSVDILKTHNIIFSKIAA